MTRQEKAAYDLKYYHKNRDKNIAQRLVRKYGITVEQREALFVSQGSMCAICKTEDPGKRGWAVDHCHTTTLVRGVLCGFCNVGLGHFRDSEVILISAISYLKSHTTKRI